MQTLYRVVIYSIALGYLLVGCAFIEMSGTMTKKTGEVMTEYSKQNEGFIGTLAGFGGRINTAVGSSVENIAKKGKADDSDSSKMDQFVSANKEVMTAAYDAASNKALSETEMVIKAQKKLKELGYYQGSTDGMLGKQTISAIKKYQSDQKLEVTKLLDSPTQASLGIIKQP